MLSATLPPMTSPADLLAWDTEFFGVRVARARAGRSSPAELQVLLAWCRDQGVELLYLLADASSTGTTLELERNGFHLMDIRLTLRFRGRPPEGVAEGASPTIPGTVRSWLPKDVAALQAIAANAHTDSRFYQDPGVPRERASALYVTWITRSCSSGFADEVLVAESDGAAAGYITVSLQPDGSGTIGLLGVGPAARGRGVGQGLVQGGMRWCLERGADQIAVVTQARNLAAQRLYQNCGFRTAGVGLWYHRWFR